MKQSYGTRQNLKRQRKPVMSPICVRGEHERCGLQKCECKCHKGPGKNRPLIEVFTWDDTQRRA